MLELRPSCENCNTPLPPNSTDAKICSYECTFCKDCVDDILQNICPNCGGGFCNRPIRPVNNRKNNNNLEHDPASTKVVYSPVNIEEHKVFSREMSTILPCDR